MAYNKELADNINETLISINPPGLTSKKMFGGVGYMIQGNMACGILNEKLIVRVGKEAYQAMLEKQGVSPFNTTGRPMTGWVMVDESVLDSGRAFMEWVAIGVDFANTLPPK